MSGRLTGFDVVKALAIFLVVAGHVWRGLHTAGMIPDTALFTRVDDAIYLFHMPLFFFLAGLFFQARGGFVAVLRSRVLLLIWPMILWSWIDAGLRAAAGIDEMSALDLLAAPFPPSGVYWFLLALFLHNMLGAALTSLPLMPRLAAMAALALTATFGLIDVRPFDFLFPTIIYLPEFLAGVAFALLARHEVLLQPRLMVPGLVLFALGQTILGIGLKAQNLFWSELAVAAAVLGFLLAAVNLPLPARGGAIMAAIGRQTMPIFLAHILFTAATRIALLRLGVDALVPHIVLGSAMGMIGPLLFVEIANRLQVSALVGFGPPPGRRVRWLRREVET
tara:strand:+ start:2806 stop:3813 length:1008 start_codon:yes stop_codon:yes gene_type:complete